MGLPDTMTNQVASLRLQGVGGSPRSHITELVGGRASGLPNPAPSIPHFSDHPPSPSLLSYVPLYT